MSIFTYIPSTQKNSQPKRIPTTKLISTNISYITSEQLHYNTILHYTIFRQHMLQQNTINKIQSNIDALYFSYIYIDSGCPYSHTYLLHKKIPNKKGYLQPNLGQLTFHVSLQNNYIYINYISFKASLTHSTKYSNR